MIYPKVFLNLIRRFILTGTAVSTFLSVNIANHLSVFAAEILNFDSLPGAPWETYSCNGNSTATVTNGILKIDSPSDCYEVSLRNSNDTWHQSVDNARGWVIETNLRIDPKSNPSCNQGRGSVHIWANDHTNLVIVGFDPNQICIAYPDYVPLQMDTTNGFHIYRIESKLNQVKVYVDGELKIDHTLTSTGGGSDVLYFGDGVGGDTSLSYWDYFSYNVFPNLSW